MQVVPQLHRRTGLPTSVCWVEWQALTAWLCMRGCGSGVDALGGEVLDQGDQGQVVLVTLATGLQGGEQLVDQGGGRQGNWSTKSRRYSTTFTVLRRARVAFAKRRGPATAFPWTPGTGPRTTTRW